MDSVIQQYIMWLALSVMLNVVIIGILAATGIGRTAVKRFRQRIQYNSGKYTNTLFVNKSGVIQEKFVKTDDDGLFRIGDKPYARNPRLLFNYEKIPTYLHLENQPDPVNPFKELESQQASSGEIDKAMMSSGNFDLKLWIQKNIMIFFIIMIGIIAAFAIGIYFNWSIYDKIVQNGATVCSEFIKQAGEVIPR